MCVCAYMCLCVCVCVCVLCRLVELAPQYYLGNLPASEGKEMLRELRQTLEQDRVSGEGEALLHSYTHPSLEERRGEGRDSQDNNDICVLQ